jgi:Golgin subfamily A member 7/ERF4 family
MAQTPLQPNYMKVFIQRDYSEGMRSDGTTMKTAGVTEFIILGTSVQFQNRFPAELESRIDRAAFERTMSKVNEYFIEAEKGNCSTFCEGFCACFSAYLIYLFTETHYEKVILKGLRHNRKQL